MKSEPDGERGTEISFPVTPRIPVYIRSDFHAALKLRATMERKKLYQLCEELLSPHIEHFRSLRLNQEILTRKDGEDI